MIKNLISSLFAKSAVALTALAILLVQSRELGSLEVGQVSLLILNLAIIQTISDIYTGTALVYFIPRFSLGRIYSRGFSWTVMCILVVNLIFYFFNVGVKDLWLHVLLLSFLLTLNAFHLVILLAKQKLKIYNFLVFFQPLLLFVMLCMNVYVLEIRTVYAYVAAAYISYSASLLISGFFTASLLNADTQKEELGFGAVFKNGFANQLGNLAHILSNRYNYYMLGTGMLVGIYASATSLIESVWILSGSISPIVLSYIANQQNNSNNSNITFLLSKICFLLSLLCVLVVLVLPEDFFTQLLGKDFAGTKTVMLYLSPGVLCLSFSSIISHYFSALGQQRILLVANCCGLLVTLCSSYYFISRFGLVGACYAASLSYMMQAAVLIVVFMKKNGLKFFTLFSLRSDLVLLSAQKENS